MLWVVEQRKLWGDYGAMLIAGMTSREGSSGPLILRRTGPFLPPISFPGAGDVVVSDDFRRVAESAGLPGLRFLPVAMSQVVRLDWHRWDWSADGPAEYPPGGEPEGYLGGRPHDSVMAAQMPPVWELVAPVVPVRMERQEDPRGGWLDRFLTNADADRVPPLFRTRPDWGYLVADDQTRQWLERHAREWVRFCPVERAAPGHFA
jgi:hypothetical protein